MAMELYELQVSTSNIHNKLNELGNSLQKEIKQNRIEEIVKMMEDPSFWLDRHLSSSLIKEMNNMDNNIEYTDEISLLENKNYKVIPCITAFLSSNECNLASIQTPKSKSLTDFSMPCFLY